MLLAAVAGTSCQKNKQTVVVSVPAEVARPSTPVIDVPKVYLRDTSIERDSNFFSALRSFDIPSSVIHNLTKSIKADVDLSKLQAGTNLLLECVDQSCTDIHRIEITDGKTQFWNVKRSPGEPDLWTAELVQREITTIPTTFAGLVDTSLWNSAEKAKMPAQVVTKMAEVFAWQIDFNRELRVGDSWRLVVERMIVEGRDIGWGNILSAEYVNVQQTYNAIRFPRQGPALGYFSDDGLNVKKLFLKSPIPFGRITSGFSNARFHPILKVHTPHNGVDYGAPPGTPVYAVGGGTVDEIVFKNTTGKHVRIRHNSVYETGYSHLQGYAKGLHRGMKVEQGQLIGYVGSTGLATGPHLHFSFFENGTFVDPQGLKFPSADPVPTDRIQEFKGEAEILLSALPPRKSTSNEDYAKERDATSAEAQTPR